MNEIISRMMQHRSVRDFEDKPLSDETKATLLKAAQSGSSSDFLQAYSIIEITDPALRKQLAGITMSGPYIEATGAYYIFVADLYRHAASLRAAGKSVDNLRNMEPLMVSIVDTAIAAENMAVAAEAMGLGICYIGSMRNNINLVADLLNLPEFTVPLFGLTIGVPKTVNEVKPRLPLRNMTSENQYDVAAFTDLAAYNNETAKYFAQRSSNQKDTDWVQENLAFYNNPRRLDVADFLKKQGFTLQ